jgi:hypothetical protein
VFLGLQRVLGPNSPAKMTKTQLWTLITFFWLGFFAPYFAKIVLAAPFWSSQKNHFL